MTGKFDGDVSSLTQQRAREEYQACFSELMASGETDPVRANQTVRQLNPELHAKAHPPRKELRDVFLKPKKMALPNEDTLKRLKLPPDATYREWETAQRAAGTGDTPDFFNMFVELCKLVGGSDVGSIHAAARARFPEIAAAADLATKERDDKSPR